jgi:hypothetical protein
VRVAMGRPFIDPEIVKRSAEAITAVRAKPRLVLPALLMSVGLLVTLVWDGLLVWGVGRIIGLW